jgi:hypothetical protein
MNDNSKWKADVQKAPKWLRSLRGYAFVVKLRQHWIDEWSDAQLAAAIFSQLLRINPSGDGSVVKYSLDFQDVLIPTFGAGYLEPGVKIANLLDEQVKLVRFHEASGQISIFDMPAEDGDAEDAEADGGNAVADDGSEGADIPPAGKSDARKLAEAEAYMDSLEALDSSENDDEE